MSRIVVWELGAKYNEEDIVILSSSDHHEIYQLDESLPIPHAIYVLSPNYSEEVFSLLIYYICLKHSDLNIKNDFIQNNRQFLIWEELIDSLNTFNIPAFRKSFDEIKVYSIGKKYHLLFEWIDNFFSFIIQPLTHSLFYELSFSDKNDNWFLNELTTKQYCERFLNTFTSDFNSKFIEQSKMFVQNKIQLLNKLTINDNNKLYFMSGYCYQLAIHSKNNYQLQASFTLLQRTLDFYFQSLAIEKGLIVPTSSGMKFNCSDDYDAKPVGMYYLEKCLRNFDVIENDKGRGEFLTWLNKSRNSLILTHGVFSVSESHVNDALQKTAQMIEHIEGSRKWIIMSEKFSLSSSFDYNIIFDSEPSIELYFTS